jgi:proline-specific peptidase
MSLQFFVNDIEGIRKSLGIEKILLLGHSWGAILVTEYALTYPDRVKGIIFSSPVALSKEFDSMTREAQVRRATSRDSTNRSIIIGSPDFKAGKADAYRRLMLFSFQHSFADENNLGKINLVLRPDYKTASQTLYAGLGKDLASYNYYGSVQRFKFPVLIQHGREDVLPLQASEKLLESIPNSRLTIYRNSGHFIFIEETKKFTQEVISFARMIHESIK